MIVAVPQSQHLPMRLSDGYMMSSLRASKLGAFAVAGTIFTFAAIQPLAADPIYHLGSGAEYFLGSGVGNFVIPSVAQGLLFYLDADDRPTEITLTGLYNNFGEKVRCLAVTRSTFACSVEAALHAHDGNDQDEWQANGLGSGGNGSLGPHDSNGPNGDDPITDVVNGSGSDLPSQFQSTNVGNDPPAGPTSVPEPGSLMLLAGALLSFAVTTRGLRRN